MEIKKNQALKAYNTFGVAVTARYFAEIESPEELATFLKQGEYESLPKMVIGGGSNILFINDFPGLVFHMAIPGIEITRENSRHVWVKAGSGVVWHRLVRFAVDRNLCGIENLSLIPGQTGAAPIQNIGAYGVELKDVFDSLEATSLESGDRRVFTSSECEFGYRNSIFKKELKGKYAINSVTLKLNKTCRFNTRYAGIEDMLAEMGVKAGEATVRDISDAVIRIRTNKLPDPSKIGNAGSFFKNPEVPVQSYNELKKDYPDIPGYKVSRMQIKIPAAWLIDKCGWKGKVTGHTGTYKNQPLVLVNHGGATGKEIFALSEKIRESVIEKFGIHLEREVNVV